MHSAHITALKLQRVADDSRCAHQCEMQHRRFMVVLAWSLLHQPGHSAQLAASMYPKRSIQGPDEICPGVGRTQKAAVVMRAPQVFCSTTASPCRPNTHLKAFIGTSFCLEWFLRRVRLSRALLCTCNASTDHEILRFPDRRNVHTAHTKIATPPAHTEALRHHQSA